MSSIHKRGPARIQANLTPMIDVTFLLIVFFVLVSQIVEVENVDLQVPELPEPASDLPGDERRAVINIVPALGDGALAYRLGSRSYPVGDEGAKRLGAQLAEMLRTNPALRINLRADHSTRFELVHPVLEAVTRAAGAAGGGARLNIVVAREDER